ncbi:MAG: histone deacetylase [Kiritimatiellae bacterium]|nr:histone deacetylase [Kiritimatiellia bacterium]
MTTGIVYDERFKLHDTRAGHPECASRCDAVLDGIRTCCNENDLSWLSPRPATMDELSLAHSPFYIETVREDVENGAMMLSTGDTDVCPDSYDVACLAAGGAVVAVDAVMSGDVDNAFCVLRPPGHHATRDRGMGFCVFNNIAVAARYVCARYGIERVAIVDWDVHHGNGTQDIFYEDSSVFFFSTHQWPFYPGSGTTDEKGAGEGRGYTLNVPLPAGACMTEVQRAFRNELLPAMRQFQPEFVFVSAGFDSRKGDLIGQMFLSDEDFYELTRLVMKIADETARGRIVSVLEGGYTPTGLASSAGAHVQALSGGLDANRLAATLLSA